MTNTVSITSPFYNTFLSCILNFYCLICQARIFHHHFSKFQSNLNQLLVVKMMTIVPQTKHAGTKIVLILASFQGTHALIQPLALLTIINPFALVHSVMKKMLMANVHQVNIAA